MHSYSKRLTAQLLLFSFLLESCYNPNISIGKRSIPQAQEASGGNTYHAEEPYSKHREQPTTHTCTTADNNSVRFTYHNGQWQAEVKECANDSCQHRQLPVVFGPGLTLRDLVDSNPTEQKQLLHICPDEDNSEQIGYVYVGISPIQAKMHLQLLSSPAARQAAPRSEVGLAQQAKPGETSPQQAQEQPGLQAVLALSSPCQQTGRDRQLPTTPARARSKPLATPSSELLSQQFAQNKFTNDQQAPRKRTHSLKNQNKLQHSQQAVQPKRQRAAAVNELAQPGRPSPAIIPLLPLVTQPPSLADKTPQGIASQVFLAQGGQQVRFMHQDGQWQASVREPIRVFSRVMKLPVACERHGGHRSSSISPARKTRQVYPAPHPCTSSSSPLPIYGLPRCAGTQRRRGWNHQEVMSTVASCLLGERSKPSMDPPRHSSILIEPLSCLKAKDLPS